MTAITDIFAPKSGGSGGVPLPTGGYVNGITAGVTPTINITAPAGKKIVFTHFRAIEWEVNDNFFDLGSVTPNTNTPFHSVSSIEIDGVDVKGSCLNMSDFMGKMQRGFGGSAQGDVSYSHAFVGIAMRSFLVTFSMSNARYAIAYTYYLADE